MAFKNQNTQQDDYSDIIDEENYSWGDKGEVNIKKIMFAHINRISEFIFKGSSSPDFRDNKKGETIKAPDRREVIIDAIYFLIGLVQPYYDEKTAQNQGKILARIKQDEETLFKISLENEAYSRALRVHPDERKESYEYWLNSLKDMQFNSIDKDTPEYEYFIDKKYQRMMKIFNLINVFMYKNDNLATKDYEE